MTSHPTISLSLTVGSNRPPHVALDPDLVSHLDEIVTVLVSPHSDVLDDWSRFLDRLQISTRTIVVSPDTHPHLYAVDLPETFAAGDPLCSEVYPGPFSCLPFVADWSAVRNLGWSECSMDWRLALSDDDVVAHPEHLPALCQHLDNLGRDVGHVIHHHGPSTYFPARIAHRDSGTQFEGVARERLVGGSRPAAAQDYLTTSFRCPSSKVEDWHATRALYAECRRSGWVVSPDDLLHLARSCRSTLPSLSAALLDLYLQTSPDSEKRAWALALAGELCENAGKMEEASLLYEQSRTSHPGWKSTLRLCHLDFRKSLWDKCVASYDSANLSLPHIHDDGEQNPSSTLILIASALHQMGRMEEARQIGASLPEIFPDNQSVASFCRSLGC